MNRIEKAPNLSSNLRTVTQTPSMHALEHFDDFYKKVYKNDWPSIRCALLSKSKFCAVLNGFADTEQIVKELTLSGCVSIKDHYLSEVKSFEEDVKKTAIDEMVKLGPDITRPIPQPTNDGDDIDANQTPKERSMTLEEAEGRIILPDSAVLGGPLLQGKKIPRSSAMFLHIPSTKLKGSEDILDESEYYKSYERVAGIPIDVKKHPLIEWPSRLEAFTFPTGNVDHFEPPRRLTSGSPFNYYCMDLASVLPVLMLDLKTGQSMLDMCAGPGGKSFVAMQTLKPGRLLCNDMDYDRVRRVMNVMDAYLKNFNEDIGHNVIQYKNGDAKKLPNLMSNEFDRVLCDVPCYTDRHIVQNDEGNIFHPTKAKSRLRLPQLQTDLLRSALLCVKPGGSVVYSTCSLSPVQNDGVIYNALKSIWEDTKIEFVVSDLSLAVQPFKSLMKISGKEIGLRYGQLVIPNLLNNFGPMYFAKINRIN